MTAADRDAAARRQRAQTIALWRWSLIEPAMDDALTSRQRGAIVRELAGREHAGALLRCAFPEYRRSMIRVLR